MSWLNPYSEPRRELRTNLSPAECGARLRRLVIGLWAFFPDAKRPLKGRVKEASFSVYRYHFGHHGLETEARGRLEADASGTRIPISFGFKLADVVFLVAWPLFVIGIGGFFVFGPGSRPDPSCADCALPRFVPFLMLAMYVFLYFILRRAARGDAEFVVRLIRETLEARETSAQAPIE